MSGHSRRRSGRKKSDRRPRQMTASGRTATDEAGSTFTVVEEPLSDPCPPLNAALGERQHSRFNTALQTIRWLSAAPAI